jgi:hypothetical protein
MKNQPAATLKRRRLIMNSRSSIVSLDRHRRAHRALRFVASLFGGGDLQDVPGLGVSIPDLKHLPHIQMDIGITRELPPTHLRSALGFARRRQFSLMLLRLRDPAHKCIELTADCLLHDGGRGVAVLDRLSLATADGRRWWLVGDDLHLRITGDGLVPTLSTPWDREEDRESLISKAEQILADYVWRD